MNRELFSDFKNKLWQLSSLGRSIVLARPCRDNRAPQVSKSHVPVRHRPCTSGYKLQICIIMRRKATLNFSLIELSFSKFQCFSTSFVNKEKLVSIKSHHLHDNKNLIIWYLGYIQHAYCIYCKCMCYIDQVPVYCPVKLRYILDIWYTTYSWYFLVKSWAILWMWWQHCGISAHTKCSTSTFRKYIVKLCKKKVKYLIYCSTVKSYIIRCIFDQMNHFHCHLKAEDPSDHTVIIMYHWKNYFLPVTKW